MVRLIALSLVLATGSAWAGALEDCMAAGENRAAAAACLELRARAAGGDLEAAVEAATTAARAFAEITSREAALHALVASERAFAIYRERECDRRRAVVDAGTGADDVWLACRADLAAARAEQLWGESGGRPDGALEVDRDWRLAALEGEAVLAGTSPTLRLEATGRAGGDAGTNRWFAAYHAGGQGLAFGAAGATMMFNDEPPGRMAQERRYLELLGEVDRWSRDGDRLRLLAHGRTVLEFE